jgi:hypothetical protein
MTTVDTFVKSRENDLRREWLEVAMADWPCSCPEPTTPSHIVETEPGWFVGYYRCPGCDLRWRCGWSMSQLRRQMRGATFPHTADPMVGGGVDRT